MSARRPLTVAIVGAGMTGLTAALLLARDGHRVTVLDRDAAPPPTAPEQAWDAWQRPGVSQFRQPHLMLPRWHHEMTHELPDVLADLADNGAARVNLLHLQPAGATGGWQPGDEQFDTLTARRPVLEAVMAIRAAAEPGLTVRRGGRTTGLLVTFDKHCPRVKGVRTTTGDVPADLVVDAAGRHTPVPRWVRDLHVAAPPERREESGFVYYARHFRADRIVPRGHGPVLTHHPSISLLTLPAEHGRYSLVLITGSRDRDLRGLRDEAVWTAVARLLPAAAPWLDGGTPTSGVLPLAGLEDVRRGYVRDGAPVVTGLVAIGDAADATNPSLGRGASIGLLHARALRDVLAEAPARPWDLAIAAHDAMTRRTQAWVDATTSFDRHRLAEMQAEACGLPYLTDDPGWPFTTALLAGAAQDPILARAAGRIAGMLAPPPEVFADPALAGRVGRLVGRVPRHTADLPDRSQILAAALPMTARP